MVTIQQMQPKKGGKKEIKKLMMVMVTMGIYMGSKINTYENYQIWMDTMMVIITCIMDMIILVNINQAKKYNKRK